MRFRGTNLTILEVIWKEDLSEGLLFVEFCYLFILCFLKTAGFFLPLCENSFWFNLLDIELKGKVMSLTPFKYAGDYKYFLPNRNSPNEAQGAVTYPE